MSNVTPSATADYTIPANQFVLFGFAFDHWDDGKGHTYADEAVIPTNTYTAGASVTLSAVMTPRDTSVNMEDGEFTFAIKGNEKAFFDGVPAGTSYSVFEENLADGWVLIAQSNSTGVIQPLEDSEALFLNKYQPDLATIQFTGRKLMDGQPAKADSFSFELWEGNTLLQTKSVIDGGFVQFDMLSYGRNDAGIHTYTIKELVGTDEAVLYDGHEETITVEVTIELGDDNIARVHAEVKSSDGTYPDILFQNWTKPGELSLTKLVDALLAGHEDDEFRFRITFKQENGLPLSDTITYSIVP
jgi:pilin isopeptide linkage protein